MNVKQSTRASLRTFAHAYANKYMCIINYMCGIRRARHFSQKELSEVLTDDIPHIALQEAALTKKILATTVE